MLRLGSGGLGGPRCLAAPPGPSQHGSTPFLHRRGSCSDASVCPTSPTSGALLSPSLHPASTSAELGVLLSRKRLLPCSPPTALATAPSLLVAGHLSHAAELDSSQLSPRLASLAQVEVVLCLRGLPYRCHRGPGGCPPEACAFPPQAWSGVVLVVVSVSVAGPPPLGHAEAPCSPGT